MLSTLDLRGGSRKASDLRNLVPRAKFDLDSVVEQVRPIIDDVRDRGVAAVQEWSEKFDGVRAPQIRVPQEIIDKSLTELDPKNDQDEIHEIQKLIEKGGYQFPSTSSKINENIGHSIRRKAVTTNFHSRKFILILYSKLFVLIMNNIINSFTFSGF
jgi:histidinol dehydrogenase